MVCRLSAEVFFLILDASDMLCIASLRYTSRNFYNLCVEYLEYARRRLLRYYVDDSDLLWELLDDFQAVIGGPAALAFVLLDLASLPNGLDVFVAGEDLGNMTRILKETHLLRHVPHRRPPGPSPRNIRETIAFTTPTNRYIYLHGSVDECALLPLVSILPTYYINYVARHTFGVGYPALTFAGLALTCDPHMRSTWRGCMYSLTSPLQDRFHTAVRPSHLPGFEIGRAHV